MSDRVGRYTIVAGCWVALLLCPIAAAVAARHEHYLGAAMMIVATAGAAALQRGLRG